MRLKFAARLAGCVTASLITVAAAYLLGALLGFAWAIWAIPFIAIADAVLNVFMIAFFVQRSRELQIAHTAELLQAERELPRHYR